MASAATGPARPGAVTVDPVDRRLWRIEGDGWAEVHEPTTRLAWQTFLAEKVDAEADGPAGARRRARLDRRADHFFAIYPR